jgi:hypothetical protein
MALLDTKQILELNQHFYSRARARMYMGHYQIIRFGRKCALPIRTLTRRL